MPLLYDLAVQRHADLTREAIQQRLCDQARRPKGPARRLALHILLALLLISLAVQQAVMAAGIDGTGEGGSPQMRQFQTRFDMVGVPERFDQVLLIVDFPAGTWTPLHTPGGHVYYTVIDGTISTRLPWTDGVYENTYQTGQSFVEWPNESMQVGNATSADTRIMATALLPRNAPLTIYRDGITSSAYPTLTDLNYTHDVVLTAPGPTTAYRSATSVDRQAGDFELVQLVLDFAASPLAADDARETCVAAWGRASTHQFERVAANLCVSSAYVPFAASPGQG